MVVLLFHSALRFLHLKLFLVRVLIPCAPVVGVLTFISPGAPAVFLREGCAGNVAPCRVLAVVQITSFLPSVRGWSSPSLMRMQGLSCSHSG
jgi:hypothetical protein